MRGARSRVSRRRRLERKCHELQGSEPQQQRSFSPEQLLWASGWHEFSPQASRTSASKTIWAGGNGGKRGAARFVKRMASIPVSNTGKFDLDSERKFRNSRSCLSRQQGSSTLAMLPHWRQICERIPLPPALAVPDSPCGRAAGGDRHHRHPHRSSRPGRAKKFGESRPIRIKCQNNLKQI